MSCLGALLAQSSRAKTIEGLRSALSPGGRDSGDSLVSLFVVCAICGFALLAIVVGRRLRERANRTPAAYGLRLFSQCLKRLGVGHVDRCLLRAAAKRCPLEHPAVMLMSPALLERFTAKWIDEMPLLSLRPVLQKRIERIAATVFTETT